MKFEDFVFYYVFKFIYIIIILSYVIKLFDFCWLGNLKYINFIKNELLFMNLIGFNCKNKIIFLNFFILILDKNFILNILLRDFIFVLYLKDFWIVDGNFVSIEDDVFFSIFEIIYLDIMNNFIIEVLFFFFFMNFWIVGVWIWKKFFFIGFKSNIFCFL